MNALFLLAALVCALPRAAAGDDFGDVGKFISNARKSGMPPLVGEGQPIKPSARSKSYSANHSLIRDYDQNSPPKSVPPYIAVYNDGISSLAFVAAKHGNKESGGDTATYALIDTVFERLKPEIVIIEGVPAGQPPSPKAIKDYKKIYEPYHAADLAGRGHIPVVGAEPEKQAEINGVTHEVDSKTQRPFTRADFEGFYVIRSLSDDRHKDAAIKQVVDEFRGEYGEPPLDEAGFLKWYEGGNGHEFSRPVPQNENQPDVRGGALSCRVSAADGRVRNGVIADTIARSLSEHHRVLVVYGAGHHDELGDVLRDMFGGLEPHYYSPANF